MGEPNPDKTETTTDEAGNEKHERSRGEDDRGKEDQIEIATDEAINEQFGGNHGVDYKIERATGEAINEVEGNNDEEGGVGTEVVDRDNVVMATEVDGDDDLVESDPSLDISGSEYGEEHHLPRQGSEDDEAYENMVEGEDDVSEDDEPMEEDFGDEDISEEEASEESGAGDEEVKLKLKDAEKSSKSSKGQADKSMKIKPADKPEPSRNRKGKAKVESMGMIFLCSSKTKDDCFRYRIFGLPESKKDVVEKIYRGMRLFLYDVDLKLMYGIYKAAGPGGYNIEPKAFKSQFPSQVRYTVLDDCLPLAEEKFKTVIKKNYYTKTKFDCKLNSLQVKQLCKLFVASSKGLRQTKPGRGPKAAKPRPSTHDRTQRERPVSNRRPAPRDGPDRRERPRKRARRILSPRAPPPTVPYANSYRRDIYSEHDRTYRDDRDPRLGQPHPYRDERVPLLERREPLLISRDASYRVAREPYLDGYRDGRGSYLEPHDPYKERRDPYLERLDPYRDGRVVSSYPVISRLDPYVDPYGTLYKRDAYGDSGRVEYRAIYGGGEPFERLVSRPLSIASSSRPRLEIGQQLVSPGERPLYSESLYSLSRAPLAREYQL